MKNAARLKTANRQSRTSPAHAGSAAASWKPNGKARSFLDVQATGYSPAGTGAPSTATPSPTTPIRP
ncbi:MAG: hypothetical protein H0X30_25910 [Anaerolineae bacterium]|nr:hypothetical protein [Anaerolineae bacterium]